MKKYEFHMLTEGNSSINAILEKVDTWENGVVKATKVAETAGFNADGSILYRKCQPREFLAWGRTYTIEEYLGPIEPGEREEAVEKIKKSIAPL